MTERQGSDAVELDGYTHIGHYAPDGFIFHWLKS